MPKSSGCRYCRRANRPLPFTDATLLQLMQFWSTLGVSKIRSALSANYVASPLGCSSACQTNISLSSIIRAYLCFTTITGPSNLAALQGEEGSGAREKFNTDDSWEA